MTQSTFKKVLNKSKISNKIKDYDMFAMSNHSYSIDQEEVLKRLAYTPSTDR